MHKPYALYAGLAGSLLLAGCGGSGGTSAPLQTLPQQSVPQSVAGQAESVAPFFDATSPLTIYVGFTHAALKKSPYGPVAFYAPTKGATQVITVKSGSKVVFMNDDTTKHTASGLGKSGFPKEYDNKSMTKPNGTIVNGSLTWSSGSLNPGQSSKQFTIGPKGTYYFGCYFHYHVTPNMRDAIVSQ